MRLWLALALAACIAAPAQAADMGPLLKGSRIYLNARDGSETLNNVWWLSADGTMTGNYQIVRPVTRGGRYVQSGNVRGTWAVDNGTLCVDAPSMRSPGRVCYEMSKGGFAKNEYVAIDKSSGFRWQVFVYRDNS